MNRCLATDGSPLSKKVLDAALVTAAAELADRWRASHCGAAAALAKRRREQAALAEIAPQIDFAPLARRLQRTIRARCRRVGAGWRPKTWSRG